MFEVLAPYVASGAGFMDLELLRANPGVLFATEYSGGIYRTVDGGDTWQRVTPAKDPAGGQAMGADFPAPVATFAHYDCNKDQWQFHVYPVIPRSRATPEFNRIELGLAQVGGGITTDWRTTVRSA